MVYLTSANRALIGFIGLGNMGAHMARNLIKKGHQLVVFDLNKQVVEDLGKLGSYQKSFFKTCKFFYPHPHLKKVPYLRHLRQKLHRKQKP
jgi:hypothetical protein